METVEKPTHKLTNEEKKARRAKRILVRRAILRERLREGKVLLWKIIKAKSTDK